MSAANRSAREGQPLQILLRSANIVLPLAYLLVAVAYGFVFFAAEARAQRAAAPALRAVILLHLAYLLGLAVHWRQFPAATESGGWSTGNLRLYWPSK